MIHRGFWLCAGIAAAGLTSGCASIVSGQSQSVSVETGTCPEASCELQNNKGKWYIGKTPASVTVHRSYEDLAVVCRKGDNVSATTSVKSSTKGLAFGNILFGGIIGAGVDMSSGAAYEYPNVIQVPLACDSAPATETKSTQSTRGPTLGLRVEDYHAAQDAQATAGDGVVVVYVHPDGIADRAGLKAGDVIHACNARAVRDADGFGESLQASAGVDVLQFSVIRDSQAMLVELQLPAKTNF